MAIYRTEGHVSAAMEPHASVAAAMASLKLDRPVRVALTRQQMFQTISRQPETRQRVRLAQDRGRRRVNRDLALIPNAGEPDAQVLDVILFDERAAPAIWHLWCG